MLNLYELAQVINEPLKIRVGGGSFSIQFEKSDVKEYKSSCLASSPWGYGKSIDEAADDYFTKINGHWLVFDAMGKTRREFSTEIAQKTVE